MSTSPAEQPGFGEVAFGEVSDGWAELENSLLAQGTDPETSDFPPVHYPGSTSDTTGGEPPRPASGSGFVFPAYI